jgi:hypothetical protein
LFGADRRDPDSGGHSEFFRRRDGRGTAHRLWLTSGFLPHRAAIHRRRRCRHGRRSRCLNLGRVGSGVIAPGSRDRTGIEDRRTADERCSAPRRASPRAEARGEDDPEKHGRTGKQQPQRILAHGMSLRAVRSGTNCESFRTGKRRGAPSRRRVCSRTLGACEVQDFASPRTCIIYAWKVHFTILGLSAPPVHLRGSLRFSRPAQPFSLGRNNVRPRASLVACRPEKRHHEGRGIRRRRREQTDSRRPEP